MKTTLVKMLTSKTTLSDCEDAYRFCLELWDDLSVSLLDSEASSFTLPSKHELDHAQGCQPILRLALLADFYMFQKDSLDLNREESTAKLFAVRAEAVKFLSNGWRSATVTALSSQSSLGPARVLPPGELSKPVTSQGRRAARKRCEPKNANLAGASERDAKRQKAAGEHTPGAGAEKKPGSQSLKNVSRWKYSVRWSKVSFSVRARSYHAKLIRAFQVVKTLGHPMLTLNSEWGLSCYYKLAVAYTTDRPLELAAACLPQLREAVNIIHSERFQKLSELTPETQMLLYAVLNCHINWVDHHHKQILLIPGQPSAQPPCEGGDLRCSRCLKNQTFHSSEVKGNPRNINVEYDFELMRFTSSCCRAPLTNVPLGTGTVDTCTFTDMKQMYTPCVTCKQPVFSEVLVDMEKLHSRCVLCTSKDL